MSTQNYQFDENMEYKTESLIENMKNIGLHQYQNMNQSMKMGQQPKRQVGKDITNIQQIDFSQFAKKSNHTRNSSSIQFNRGSFPNNNSNNNNNTKEKKNSQVKNNKNNNSIMNDSQNEMGTSYNNYVAKRSNKAQSKKQSKDVLRTSKNFGQSTLDTNTSISSGQQQLQQLPSFLQTTMCSQENLCFSKNNTNGSMVYNKPNINNGQRPNNYSMNNYNNNNNNSNNNNNMINLYQSNTNNLRNVVNGIQVMNISGNNTSKDSQQQKQQQQNLHFRYMTQNSDNYEEDGYNKENCPPPAEYVNGIEITDNLKEIKDYLPDIIEHLRNTEEQYLVMADYLSKVQKDINEKMRGILLDWLIDVHLKFKLLPETLFITINLIDRYLCAVDIPRTQLQLVGVASLFIACKYEEVYAVPHIKDLVYVCDKAYTKEQILEMEGSIIYELNFNVLSVSSLRFLEYYSKQAKMDDKNYMLCRYLLEMALLELKMSQYKPSMIACAAIYLVHKIRKNSQPWSQEDMLKHTKYQESQVRPCAKDLCSLLQTVEQRPSYKSLKRKFSLPKFFEVAKIRIERKQQNQTTQQQQNQSQQMKQQQKTQTVQQQIHASQQQQIRQSQQQQQQQQSQSQLRSMLDSHQNPQDFKNNAIEIEQNKFQNC